MSEKTVIGKLDSNGKIEDLIHQLEKELQKGATNYDISVTESKDWNFKWLETYKLKTAEQIKQERIEALEKELKELKGEY